MQLFGLGEISDEEITLIHPERAKKCWKISTFVEKCAIVIRLQPDCECSSDREPTTGLRHIGDIVIMLTRQIVDLCIHLIFIIRPLQTEVKLTETAVVLSFSCLCTIKPTSPVFIDELPLGTEVTDDTMSDGCNELMTQIDQLACIAGSLFLIPSFLIVVAITHRHVLQPCVRMVLREIESQ